MLCMCIGLVCVCAWMHCMRMVLCVRCMRVVLCVLLFAHGVVCPLYVRGCVCVIQTPLHYAAASTHGSLCLEMLLNENVDLGPKVVILHKIRANHCNSTNLEHFLTVNPVNIVNSLKEM